MNLQGGNRQNMYLDERSEWILNDILAENKIHTKELCKKYNISLRQLMYSVEKINTYLVEKGEEPVLKSRMGELQVSENSRKILDQWLKEMNNKNYVPSELERSQLIMFMVITMEEELSLQHFVSELKVSKNTILSDLKIVRKDLKKYSCELQYTRLKGYFIKGNEFDIRKVLIELVNLILNIPYGKYMMEHIAKVTKEELQKVTDWLEAIERDLKISYTDDKMESAPYTVALIYRRIENGHYIKEDDMIFQELYDTKEYAFAEKLLSSIGEVPRQERFFITLQLLSTNIVGESVLSENQMAKMKQAIEEVIMKFENQACIVFQDRDRLVQMLVQHMKPAYYRIKYHLTLTTDLIDLVKIKMQEKELQEIYLLLRQCMEPIEKLVGCQIPEIEMQFITMFVASWFQKEGQRFIEKPRTLVVCPNGITVSKVMYSTLKALFPEFDFLKSVSVREYEEMDDNAYDLIFSPVRLKTKKKIFIVQPVITVDDKKLLRKKVLENVYGIKTVDYDVDDIYRIIKKYMKNGISVRQEKNLKKELKNYLSIKIDDNDEKDSSCEDIDLTDLIYQNYIQQERKVSNWKEAMELVAQPLLDYGNVTEEYVEKVIRQYNDQSIHIIFGGKIAVPHGMPSFGVNKLGMSMLVIRDPVKFGGLDIHIFIMLAPEDEKKHLKAMLQMTDLAADHEGITRIIEAKSKEEIIEILKLYQ